MYSTFDTYNPTKEDLIVNAPEGATHFVKEDRDYNFTWLKKVLSTWQCRTLNCDRWAQWLGSFPDKIYELPSVSVFEENPTTIRERILEIRKEREAGIKEEQDLIDKLSSMGFKLIENINEKLEEAKEQHDLQDWRNWKAGDILVSCEDSHGWFTAGNKYEVLYIDVNDHNQVKIVEDDIGAANGWSAKFFKFHSRPTK